MTPNQKSELPGCKPLRGFASKLRNRLIAPSFTIFSVIGGQLCESLWLSPILALDKGVSVRTLGR